MSDLPPKRSGDAGAATTPSSGSARPARRKPRGYDGHRHETLGSDILAVRDALANLSRAVSDEEVRATCRKVLGVEAASRIEAVSAERWYPIELMLDLMETIEAKVGHNGLRRMGRLLFQRTHAARFSEVAKHARDVVYGIDALCTAVQPRQSRDAHRRVEGALVFELSGRAREDHAAPLRDGRGNPLGGLRDARRPHDGLAARVLSKRRRSGAST